MEMKQKPNFEMNELTLESPQFPFLDFLLAHKDEELSVFEIGRRVGLDKSQSNNAWKMLYLKKYLCKTERMKKIKKSKLGEQRYRVVIPKFTKKGEFYTKRLFENFGYKRTWA